MLIEVKNLVKKYNSFTAVDNISLSVTKGECLGILGPNGAGKTTTVKIIQCISPKTSGEVSVFDMPASIDSREIRARIGVVPQDNTLDTDISVFNNLMLFGAFFDIPKKTLKERVTQLLSFMELTEKRNNRIEELSGGMKRRLLIARSLLNAPELLILDEPTTGLDPQARHMIWSRLAELKRSGMTMILTTHYMEEAYKLCDRLIVMDKSKIIAEGLPNQMITAAGCNNLEELFLKLTGRKLNE